MHDWQYFRAGGFAQISLKRGSDIAALRSLDQKLWTALACPVDGIRFDPQTLALIDSDGDGRIRAPELLEAIDWVLGRLRDPDALIDAGDTLPLSMLDETRPEGEAIGNAARRTLQQLGRAGEQSITLAEALDAADLLTAQPLNGDGIVTQGCVTDGALCELIEAVVATGFGVADRNGVARVGSVDLATFLEAAAATRAWRAEAAVDPATRPVGDLGIEREEVRAFPLARVAAGGTLPLQEGVNPAWLEPIRRLHDVAIAPLLGARAELDEQARQELRSRLAPFVAWRSRRPADAIETLDDETLGAICATGQVAALETLIAADREVEPAFNALVDMGWLQGLIGR